MATDNTLRIGLILPEVLGTYGDNGNALVLQQRALMRDIDADIISISLGEAVPDSLDIYTVGGGEDTAQILAADHLLKDGGLGRAATQGTPILAICAGLQVLGESFRADGRIVDGVGLIDATTVAMEKRAIGEVTTTPTGTGWTAPLTEKLSGFENHMGATVLGPDAKPLGKVIRGVGNCDKHAVQELGLDPAQNYAEGAVQGSVLSTYMHGPLLARNPQVADLLLAKALGVELNDLVPLNIEVIEQLRKERINS